MKNLIRWLNAAGLAAVLAVNGLAQWLPINGKTTGEISAKYPVLITPAPYAFSIWSIIYLLLIGFVIYQFKPRAGKSKNVQNIGPWFIISCLFNVAWILLWHYEKLTSSVFIMFALLISLIVIYSAIRKDKQPPAPMEQWLVRLPFSIYLGWICVASIVNAAVVLYAAEWNGFGLSDAAWTITLLIAASLLAVVIGFRFVDPAFVLVFVWSFIAIAVKQDQQPEVSLSASIAAAILMIAAIVIWVQARKGKQLHIEK